MSHERKLEELLGDWRRSGVPLEDAEVNQARSECLVPKIACSIDAHAVQRARKRRTRQLVYALGAAAALAVGLGTWWSASAPKLAPAAVIEALHGGAVAREVALEDAVTSEAEPLRVRLAAGPVVELEPKSTIAIAEAAPRSQVVRLSRGAISVVVPKLEPPGAFAVQTADARVVVHGTRFVVSIGEPATNGARTRVHVNEGRVSVRYRGSESMLTAGESWPPPSNASIAPPRAAEPSPPQPARSTAFAPRQALPSARATAPTNPTTSAALAEQNRLFSTARAARRRGDDRGAIALLDQLLREHPKSPLLPEARVERFRALKRLGDEREAAREAKQYLLEHKDGYARDEARELVLPTRKP